LYPSEPRGNSNLVSKREVTEKSGEGKHKRGEDLHGKGNVMRKKLEEYIEKEREKLKGESEKEREDKEVKSRFRKIKDGADPSSLNYIQVCRLITEPNVICEVNRIHPNIAREMYYNILKKHSASIRQLTEALSMIRGVEVEYYGSSGRLSIGRAVSSIASGKPGAMFEKTLHIPGIDVALLIDQSSSMDAFGKIHAAREAVIVLAEALSSVPGCRFAVYGFWSKPHHTVSGHIRYYYTVEYKGFSHGSERHWLLGSISTGEQNRDGYHIRVVADRLMSQGRTGVKKMFIMLSDGEPLDYGTEYVGEVAFEDTRRAVNEAKQRGIAFITLGFTVLSKSIHSRIYGDNCVFVDDPASLTEAFKRLALLIQRMAVSI
jgi:hypothetical protein